MSRNLKRDYIKKIMAIEAPNGYKFDLANYIYNPSYDYDYPSFTKMLVEDDDTQTYRRVYYIKHYDGTGEYTEEIYTRQKDGDSWQFVNPVEKVLEAANRFNIDKLLSFC